MFWTCRRAFWVLQHLQCCMSRRLRLCRWAVPAVDVDNARCLLAPVPQACRINVLVSAACALEGQNLELYLCLRPW